VVSNYLNSATSSIATLSVTIGAQTNLRLMANSFTNGAFMLTVTGPPFTTAAIESSTNLTTWLSLYTNITDSSGSFPFTDTTAGWFTYRFYRARQQ
jgi:hypothetical protein